MFDPIMIAVMTFTVVILAMLGGFILLLPISRLAGEALRVWIEQRPDTKSLGAEVGRLRAELDDTRERLELLAEHQSFVERALARDPAIKG